MSNILKSNYYKHLMSLLNKAGIRDKKERCLFASRMLSKEVNTFKDLSYEDIESLIKILYSWKYIQELRLMNGTMEIESYLITSATNASEDIDISPYSVLFSRIKEIKENIEKIKKEGASMAAKSTKASTDSKRKSIDDFYQTLSEIEKETGQHSKEMIAQKGRWDKEYIINAPSISIGLATGIGGFPRGKIIQLWGEKHSGKSMMAGIMMANAQKQGIPSVYIDAEAAADYSFLQQLGVDTDNKDIAPIVRYLPPNLEALCDMLRKFAKKSNALIVVDSVGSSESEAEINRNIHKDSPRVGGNAFLWKSIISSIRPSLEESGSTVILINQVRSKMSAGMYEEKDKPYGTEAIQHGSDFTIKTGKRKEINDTLKKRGYEMTTVRVDKNRYSDRATSRSIGYLPGYPYNKSIDLLRSAGDWTIHPSSEMTYGELAHSCIRSGYIADPDNPQEIVSKRNRYVVRIDPDILAAIRYDDPDFDADGDVDFEASTGYVPVPETLEEWRDNGFRWDFPSVDLEKPYVFYTLPGNGILSAAKWLKNHPQVREALGERLLDGLNDRPDLVKEFATDV